MRSNYWAVIYAHDRRMHRHRCLCCRKIVNAGEDVLMARVATKVTRVLHESCADRLFTINGVVQPWTWRDLLDNHGHAYRVACGERLPQHPLSVVS